jgi:hypothetical protein
VQLVHAIIAVYLIVTLMATALAKFKNWQVASAGVARESVFPVPIAPIIIFVVSTAEFVLATFFMLGFQSMVRGFAVAGVFLAFLGYQLLVARKSNSLMCACAGAARTDPASVPAVTGTAVSCLMQASLSCGLAMTGSVTGVFHLATIFAWVIPVAVFVSGFFRRRSRSGASNQIPVWSPYRNYDIGELKDQGS